MAEHCEFTDCFLPRRNSKQTLCNSHYRQQIRGESLRPFRQMRSSAEVEEELALGLRTCCDCKRQLSVTEFHKADTHGRGLCSTCKRCGLSRRRENKYGISTPEWEEMFRGQGCACAICRTKNAEWHTDHDHNTGLVRSILCRNCNLKLGHFEKWYLPNREAVDAYLNLKAEV